MRVLLDLLDATHDAAARASGSPPFPYVVCSTPRSGSGLLCRRLAAAGAGVPVEYFNPLHRDALTERWGCGRALREYLGALLARRTSASGVFGVKLHWSQLIALRAEALGVQDGEPGYAVDAGFLRALLPGVRFVRIVRLDVDRQAVSLWFSLATGVWSAAAHDDDAPAPRAEVPYRFEGIDRCRRLIENAELHWDRFLRANGIEAPVVTYEQLVADPAGTAAAVAGALLPPGAPTLRRALPSSRRLADARSEAFVARFRVERRDRALPDPLAS